MSNTDFNPEPGAPPPQTSQPLARTNPGPGQPSPGNIPITPKLSPSVYIPPAPNRDPSEIGSDWWPTKSAMAYAGDGPAPSSNFFPAPQEGYKLIQDTGSRLAMTAPPAVAEPARAAGDIAARFAPLIDVFTRGSFSPGFMQANAAQIQRQMGALRIQQEQMVIQAEQAQEAHQAILEDYGQVFGLAGAKDKAGNPIISEQQAEDRLMYLARIHGDGTLQTIIADGGMKAAAKYLQQQDQLWRMLHAGSTAVKRATSGEMTDAEEQAAAGYTSDQSGLYGGAQAFSGGATGGLNFGAMLGEPEGETKSDAASDVDTEDNDFNKYIKEKLGYSDRVIQDAHDVFNGGENKWKKNGVVYNQVENAVSALRGAIHHIASDSTPDDPDHPENSKIERIKRVDPETAALMEGLRTYKLDPASEQLKGGHRAEVVRMTSQVFPGYKQGFYQINKTQWENQSSPTYYKIFSANRVGTSLLPLMNAINSLPIDEGANIPDAVWSKLINGQLHGDPTYGVLNDTLGAFARESIATQTGSRGGTVSFVNQMMQGLPVGGTKAQLRAAVRASVIGTDNIVTKLQKDYSKASGLPKEDMPGFDTLTRDVYDGIERMNPYNGKFAKDAPEQLKIVSPYSLDPEGKWRKKTPAWMTPDKNYEPVDKKTYDKLFNWLQANPDDPRADKLRHELGVMQ